MTEEITEKVFNHCQKKSCPYFLNNDGLCSKFKTLSKTYVPCQDCPLDCFTKCKKCKNKPMILSFENLKRLSIK